jgi:HAE1 family hydrophobic/amphiphilic exporter-1
VLAGAVVIPSLPVAQFPQVAPPVVTVSATYTGANSQTVEASVTTPLEEAINGVDGLRYITSTSTNQGVSTITCTFNLERSLDLAATDVQTAVNNTLGLLPAAVRNTGVTVSKNSGQFLIGLALTSDDPRFDPLYLSNYATLNVVDPLKRIKGVNDAHLFGVSKYAMRLWLDPKKLADNGLAASDVVSALNDQNVDVASGSIGAPPAGADQPYQISTSTIGRLTSPEQFEHLILRTTPNGGVVHVSDVGRVQLGAQDYTTDFRLNGKEAIGIAILILPDANATDVSKQVFAEMDLLQKSFPAGVHYTVGFDGTTFVTESIKEVLKTLLISIVLVVIVVFLFLQDWRTTLVPAVTIPVSLIGTFALMKVLGFSINTLTLFGLTLATGLVVDDAIVVIENIARYVQEKGMDPVEGASLAMREIVGAVIASSIVLLAVFLPVSFFPGTTGQLYKQFALTIGCTITISLFNALTLTPALSALLLRPEEVKRGRFFGAVNRVIHGSRSWYHDVLPRLIAWRGPILGIFALGMLGTFFAYRAIPTGFLPDEDQGYFFVTVQLPEGSPINQTLTVTKRVEGILNGFPEVRTLFEINGFSFTGQATNRALVFVRLYDWDARPARAQSASGIIARLQPKFARIADAQVLAFNPPAIRGIGNLAGFQFELTDPGNLPIDQLYGTAEDMIRAGNFGSHLRNVSTTYRVDNPQLVIDVDRRKAESLGVPVSTIFTTLDVMVGSVYVNDFNYLNRTFRVYVQADAPYRTRLSALQTIYVRSNAGGSIPLSSLIQTHMIKVAPQITHYNLYRSIELNGVPAPGYGSGDAIESMQKIAARTIPAGMSYEWSGISLEQIQFGGQAIFIFGLGVVFVFLTLAAKYESWTDPLIILLSVPLAILGAILALDARGLQSDLYAQVGYLMLIALASKNAILIVEFANQRRASGIETRAAVREAAQTRFRPIVMTSLAFISAVMPLVLASGAGAASRHSLGTAVVGGMVLSTILNLFLVPVFYVVVVTLRERLSRRPRPAFATNGAGVVPGPSNGDAEDAPDAERHGSRP